MKDIIENEIMQSSNVIKNSVSLSNIISQTIDEIVHCLKNKNKIILFGNGGSAADAQHIAAEFLGKFLIERQSLPAIALSTNSSTITALGNDYSIETIFSRQCEALVNPGDVVIGISTSGNSKNILEGLRLSKTKGAKTIGLLGNGGGMIKDLADISLIVPSDSVPHIQETHRVIYHIICDHVEQLLQ